jgi:hypothetical protein
MDNILVRFPTFIRQCKRQLSETGSTVDSVYLIVVWIDPRDWQIDPCFLSPSDFDEHF